MRITVSTICSWLIAFSILQGCGSDPKDRAPSPVRDVEDEKLLQALRAEKKQIDLDIKNQNHARMKGVAEDGQKRQFAYDQAKLRVIKAECIGKMTVLPLPMQKLFLKKMAFPGETWHNRKTSFTKVELQNIFDGSKVEQLQNFVNELENIKIEEKKRTKEEWLDLVAQHPDVFLGEEIAEDKKVDWDAEIRYRPEDGNTPEVSGEITQIPESEGLTDSEMKELTSDAASELFKEAFANESFEQNADTADVKRALEKRGFAGNSLDKALRFFIFLYYRQGQNKTTVLHDVDSYCKLYEEVQESWPEQLCFWDHCQACWDGNTKGWLREYHVIHNHSKELFELFLEYQSRAAEFKRAEQLLLKIMNLMKDRNLTYALLNRQQQNFLSRLQSSWAHLSGLKEELYGKLQEGKAKHQYADGEDVNFEREAWLQQYVSEETSKSPKPETKRKKGKKKQAKNLLNKNS